MERQVLTLQDPPDKSLAINKVSSWFSPTQVTESLWESAMGSIQRIISNLLQQKEDDPLYMYCMYYAEMTGACKNII